MRPRPRFGGATTVVSVVCFVVVLTGCAGMVGNHGPAFAGSRGAGLNLSVVNRNFEAVRVYMLRGATRMSLGKVEGMGTREFNISEARLGCERVLRLAIVATPSYNRITMIPIDVGPGQMVEATIGTTFNNSYVLAR